MERADRAGATFVGMTVTEVRLGQSSPGYGGRIARLGRGVVRLAGKSPLARQVHDSLCVSQLADRGPSTRCPTARGGHPGPHGVAVMTTSGSGTCWQPQTPTGGCRRVRSGPPGISSRDDAGGPPSAAATRVRHNGGRRACVDHRPPRRAAQDPRELGEGPAFARARRGVLVPRAWGPGDSIERKHRRRVALRPPGCRVRRSASRHGPWRERSFHG